LNVFEKETTITKLPDGIVWHYSPLFSSVSNCLALLPTIKCNYRPPKRSGVVFFEMFLETTLAGLKDL
jgi:hypothetical protein